MQFVRWLSISLFSCSKFVISVSFLLLVGNGPAYAQWRGFSYFCLFLLCYLFYSYFFQFKHFTRHCVYAVLWCVIIYSFKKSNQRKISHIPFSFIKNSIHYNHYKVIKIQENYYWYRYQSFKSNDCFNAGNSNKKENYNDY